MSPILQPTGWTIVAVLKSEDSREQFRDDILMPPVMHQGIEGRFGAPREESTFEAYKSMP